MNNKKIRVSPEFEKALRNIKENFEKKFNINISQTQATKIIGAKVSGLEIVEIKRWKKSRPLQVRIK